MNVSMWKTILGEEEKKLLADVIDSGMLSEGAKTKDFEKRMAELIGSKYAVTVTSGGVSLYLGLMALDVGFGDEVIVPDYQMIALLNAVFMTGATPVLVDVDPMNGNVSVNEVKKKITKKTKCIAAVHMNGRYADMEPINEMAQENNIAVLEDACQCLGSFYNHRHLGTFSSLGCMSFHPTKIVTTGNGGMIVTDSYDIYEKIIMFKDYGRIGRGVKELPAQIAQWGLNFRFTEMQAAIGLVQLSRLGSRIERVKEIQRTYRDGLKGCFHLPIYEGYLPWVVDVHLDLPGSNTRLQERLKHKYGIDSKLPYTPVHILRSISGDFQGAEYWFSKGFWLPTCPALTDKEISYVVDSFNAAVKDL